MTHALDPDASAALREAGVDEAEALAALARHHAAGLERVEFARRSVGPRRFDAARPETFLRTVALHAQAWLHADGSLRSVRWTTRERVTRLDRELWRAWTAPALVRLLHVVTGDRRHLEEPVAWLSARTGLAVVWAHRDSDEPELGLRAPNGEPAGWARWMFAETAADLWEAWLGERGWSFAAGRYAATSPSGRDYPWGLSVREDVTDALVVAFAREGLDLPAELAASDVRRRELLGDAPAAGGPLPLLTSGARPA